MYITSEQLDKKLRSSCRKFTARLEVEDMQLDSIKSVSLERGITSGDTLTICNSVSSSATVITEQLNFNMEGKKAALYFVIDNTDIPMGHYYITNQSSKAGLTTLKMSDVLSNGAVKLYVSSLLFPAKDTDVINEICTKLGIRFVNNLKSNLIIRKKPTGYTMREIIGYIAGKHGKNAVIDREGKLRFIWFEDNDYELNQDYVSDPEVSAGTIVINSLVVNKNETESYKRGNQQVVITVNNPFMEEADMNEAYESVKGLTYKVATVEMILGDPRLDVWDIVTYKNIKIPCMNLELEYDGGIKLKLKSVGKTATENEIDIKGPGQKQIEKYAIELAAINEAVIHKLDADEANMTYATIYDLQVTNEAVIKKLNADEASLLYAKIEDLNVEKEKVNTIEAKMLTSDSAEVKALQAEVGHVNNLIFGSATGTTIQTEFSNSVIAQLGDAQIKSAMIENMSADKINSGALYTNLVEITSQSGNIDIKDNTLKITDSNSIPRVQIGKDASNDYNMYIWDSTGSLMFDALGLTEKGIKREIIRNDMVSQNANISAEKLDIDTLFGVINNDASHTLKSSKIYVDAENQTMDIAFKKLTDKTDAIEDTVTSQGTAINVVQGQINTKIWQQDITTAVNDIEIGGRNIAAETTDEYKTVAIGRYYTTIYSIPISDLTEKYGLHDGDYITFSVYIKANSEKQLCGMIQHHNSNEDRAGKNGTYIENKEGMSYVTTQLNTSYTTLQLCIRNVTNTITETTRESYKCIKLEKGTKATDWTPSPEDTDSKITTLSTNYTKLDQSLTGLTAEVAGNTSTIATKADNSVVTEIQNNLTTVTADLNGFKTTVSSTYTTKTQFDSLEIGGRNLIINSKLEIGYINSNGTITTSNNYRVTDYIKVNAGDNLIFQAWGDFVTRGWWDITNFDENKTYIGGYGNAYWNSGTHYIQESNIVPDGTAYIRLSFTTPSESGIVKLEKGNKATDWTPAPEDVDSSIEAVDTHLTTVEQTADKINWIVKSGSSQSNFTLTDRLAELTAEIISLNGNVKVSKDMIVDGAITAKKIATDAIKSRNYIKNKYGSYLNLTNGSFDSPYLKFSSTGLSIGSIKVTTDTDDYGKIKGGIYAELINSDSGTVGGHGEVYRTFLNPTILENINTTYILGFSVYNSYDMSWIRTPFSVRSDGWIRTDSNIMAKGYLSISQFIKANGDIWSDNGCVRTGNGGITADGKFYSQSTEYPNIRGNGTYLHLNYTNENTKGLVCENGSVRPAGDSNQSLGRTDKRWSTVYAFTSMISTSDRNEKNTINKLDETLVIDFIKGLKPVSYKYNNGTSGRTHMGLISQDIEELLTSLGLDSLDFAGFIKSPKIQTTETERTDENGNPIIETKEQIIKNKFNYGLRYEEFISPIIKFVQIQEDRIASLEEQVKNQQREIEELKSNFK